MLFPIRETPNETPGVSPFELSGRKVKGPLQLVKDKLLDSTVHRLVTVTHYLDNLKSTLHKVHKVLHKVHLPTLISSKHNVG